MRNNGALSFLVLKKECSLVVGRVRQLAKFLAHFVREGLVLGQVIELAPSEFFRGKIQGLQDRFDVEAGGVGTLDPKNLAHCVPMHRPASQ